MRKLLHVFPGGNYDTFALNLATHSPDSVEVFLIFIKPLPHEFSNVLNDKSVNFRSGLSSSFDRSTSRLFAAKRVAKEILHVDPDEIYLHGSPVGLLGMIASLILLDRSRFTFVRHHNKMNRLLRVKKAMLLDVLQAKFFTSFVAVSDEVYKSLVEDGANLHKIRVIPNGICLDTFSLKKDNRKRRTKYRKNFKVLMIGRLAPEKNYPLAIDVFCKLELMGLNFSVSVLGDGPLRESLSELAQSKLRSPDSFKLIGHVEDISEYVESCDLFLHLAIDEACSISVIECLALQAPVLVLPRGGIVNVTPEQYWLASEEPDAIAVEIAAFMKNSKPLLPLSSFDLESYREFYSSKRMAGDYANLRSRI